MRDGRRGLAQSPTSVSTAGNVAFTQAQSLDHNSPALVGTRL